jgi:hypothetical protein
MSELVELLTICTGLFVIPFKATFIGIKHLSTITYARHLHIVVGCDIFSCKWAIWLPEIKRLQPHWEFNFIILSNETKFSGQWRII